MPVDIEEEPEILLSNEEESLFQDILAGRGSGKEYTKLDFDDAVDLAYYLDDALLRGERDLHPWQVETLVFLSQNNVFTCKDALQYVLAACNGSGKDAYIIAPFAIFISLTVIRHRTIISTASYTQLKNQTQNYIRTLANAANKRLIETGKLLEGEKAFIVKKDHIVCTLTGSEVIMFVTDDPGRAEGYHPWPDCPTHELCIMLNEAKTIPDEIFNSFRRCTYNRWIEVSSTGRTSGHFYNIARRARRWEDGYQKGSPIFRRITAYDCPHIGNEKIEDAKREMGETSPLFLSMFMSVFVSLDEFVIITKEAVDKCLDNPPEYCEALEIPLRAGLDLAAGGDEDVLCLILNNKVVGLTAFRMSDTTLAWKILIKKFEEFKILPQNIFADDGGVGRPIIDDLHANGWPVNRVRNQSPPRLKQEYGNLGAELATNAALIVGRCLIDLTIVKNDLKFISQLHSRHFKQHGTSGKIVLESKVEAKRGGHGSPDRFDAFVLALTGLSWQDFDPVERKVKLKEPETPVGTRAYSMDHLAKEIKKQTRLNIRFSGSDVEDTFGRHLGTLLPILTDKPGKVVPANTPITALRKLYTKGRH